MPNKLLDVRTGQRRYLVCQLARVPSHVKAAVRLLLIISEWLDCQRAKIYHRFINYHDIITIEPGKRGGKPCIRGMRMTVYDVLEYLASGMTIQEILDDFPYLTHEDILACLAFAADREKNLLVVQA